MESLFELGLLYYQNGVNMLQNTKVTAMQYITNNQLLKENIKYTILSNRYTYCLLLCKHKY